MNATILDLYDTIANTEALLFEAMRNDNDNQAEFLQDKLDMLREKAILASSHKELVAA